MKRKENRVQSTNSELYKSHYIKKIPSASRRIPLYFLYIRYRAQSKTTNGKTKKQNRKYHSLVHCSFPVRHKQNETEQNESCAATPRQPTNAKRIGTYGLASTRRGRFLRARVANGSRTVAKKGGEPVSNFYQIRIISLVA